MEAQVYRYETTDSVSSHFILMETTLCLGIEMVIEEIDTGEKLEVPLFLGLVQRSNEKWKVK